MALVITVIVLLLLLNALYVGAEFAAVSARRSRLAQLAEEGSRTARLVLSLVDNPERLDTYVAACQLGITATSLVLGFYAQSQLSGVVAPWLAQLGVVTPAAAASLSATVILLVLTAVQMIVGELVPKNIGVQYPEQLAMATVQAMRWSIILFRPLIWLFNGSGRLILRLFGVKPMAEHAHIHSPDEIALLVQESGAGGLLDQEERRLIENTLWLRKATIHQVMIPRTRMQAAPVDQPVDALFRLLSDSPYSRLPLYDGTIDNIVGVVHLKDLLCLRQRAQQVDVREVMNEPIFVPDSMAADEALALLQRRRYHVAIVLDEYGGTAGIVALEDLIEEIFGELQDEFDQEVPLYRVLPGGRVMLRWDWLVDDVNDLLDMHLPSDEADTIGGLVLSELGYVPQVGDEVVLLKSPVDGDTPDNRIALRVEKVEGKAVAAVSLPVTPDQLRRLREETW